ncbi:MAG: IPT/TIG domain-containing protein, partial [Burkholderiales bacterium]|nr:IPT/TIG domain-containing protein [Phycisphaerae bacterium]
MRRNKKDEQHFIEQLEERVFLAFAIGDRVQTVGSTASRASASTSAQEYATITTGQLGTVKTNVTNNQGFEWYRVDWDNYNLPLSDGWSAGGSPRFILAAAPAPSISSVSPTSMPASGSLQNLTINGSNFSTSATLTFDPPTGSNIDSQEIRF